MELLSALPVLSEAPSHFNEIISWDALGNCLGQKILEPPLAGSLSKPYLQTIIYYPFNCAALLLKLKLVNIFQQEPLVTSFIYPNAPSLLAK